MRGLTLPYQNGVMAIISEGTRHAQRWGGHCQTTSGSQALQSRGGRPVFVRSLGSEGRRSLKEAGPLFVRIPAGTEGTKGPGVEVDW